MFASLEAERTPWDAELKPKMCQPQEIFEAVMDAHERCENIVEICGGDDDDDSGPIKHFPTPKETLEATSLLSDYIDTCPQTRRTSWEFPLSNLCALWNNRGYEGDSY